MRYLSLSAWIFVILILMVALMILFPTPLTIGLGTIGVPVMILVQTLIVLFAKEESEHTFSDDHWYDKK